MKKPLLSLKDSVRKRAGNCCEKCGKKVGRNRGRMITSSVHHRKPRRLGGADTICNLVLLCQTCHREIHRDEDEAARTGWIAWNDPEVTPLLRHTGGWALLVPDGSFEYLSHPEGERLVEYTNDLVKSFAM